MVKYGLSCALRKSRGLKQYFTVLSDLSPNTDIVPFLQGFIEFFEFLSVCQLLFFLKMDQHSSPNG